MPEFASKINKQITTIYSSFSHAARQLEGLVAVDYFFAQQISQCLGFSTPDKEISPIKQQALEQKERVQQQWFHLLIALSATMRAGHSCLPIIEVAGKRWFFDGLNQGAGVSENQTGFLFAELAELTALLTKLAIAPSENNAPQPIVFCHQQLYLRRYYQFEQELKQVVGARRVTTPQQLAQTDSADNIEIIQAIISRLFPDLTIEGQLENQQASRVESREIDWQAVAVANAINKNFAIIAGGPGTGKTYTVTKLLAALIMLASAQSENSGKAKANIDDINAPRICLVAPTGKAAQRLSESIVSAVQGFRGAIDDKVLDLIPEQAQTIHRLLGVIPQQVNFRHHQENLLDIDILLIDEVSMVDLPMMTRIFRALPASTKVILLGDADQLPSVAVGSVLADLAPRPHLGYSTANHHYLSKVTGYHALAKDSLTPITSQQYSAADCVTFLMKSRRFDGEGGIGRIANYVINGQYQQSWQLLQLTNKVHDEAHGAAASNNSELSLLPSNIDTWLPPLVTQYYQGISQCECVEDAFGLLARFRILSSTRKGPQGVESLNALVIDILRDKGVIPFNSFGANSALYASQPIMINENDYRLGVYNGDIGLLWKNSHGHLMAVFENADGDYKWIMPSRLPKFETVYAMTIHKTQGSEFEHVAMVLPEQKDNKLLSRELLYTGITRAKQQLSIASSESVWQRGVSQKVKRYSGLALD